MAISARDKEILIRLSELYNELARYKDSEVFRKSYFKYSSEEIDKTIQKIINQENENAEVKKKVVREEILNIDSIEMAKKFYLENLVYDKNEEGAKQKCLKNISLDELKVLYNRVYEKEARSRITKEEVLSLIEKYFNSIDRALSMKP